MDGSQIDQTIVRQMTKLSSEILSPLLTLWAPRVTRKTFNDHPDMCKKCPNNLKNDQKHVPMITKRNWTAHHVFFAIASRGFSPRKVTLLFEIKKHQKPKIMQTEKEVKKDEGRQIMPIRLAHFRKSLIWNWKLWTNTNLDLGESGGFSNYWD